WAGDAEIWVVEAVEAFHPQFGACRFTQYKSALQRKIEEVISGSRQDIAAGIAERVGRRRAERVRVEELIGGALIPGKAHRNAGDYVGTIRRSAVRAVVGEVDGVQRRAVLQRRDTADLPIRKRAPKHAHT